MRRTLRGLTGTTRAPRCTYTEFVLNDLGRFKELQNEEKDYNTHMPTIGRYEAMLEKWEALGKARFEMDEEQLRRVLDAVYLR